MENERSFVIMAEPWDTVATLKQKVHDSQGIAVENQQLHFAGKVLENQLSAADCDLFTRGKLALRVVQASGGGKESLPMPVGKPPFTLKELREAIPEHCFERSYLRSFGYLALDFVKLAALGTIFFGYETVLEPVLPSVVTYAFYVAYIFALGTVGTALWVLAHDCGHHAFSPNKWLNDIVGWAIHSSLLLPYHAWRESHRRHHAKTGHLEDDEVFVPFTRSEIGDDIPTSPTYYVAKILGILVFGFPMYLFFNTSGPRKYRQPGKKRSHFEPDSVVFSPRDRIGIIIGDIGVAGVFAVACYLTHTLGWRTMVLHYWAPWLVVYIELVAITYLHHTAVYVPRFASEEWEWLRGALCTVDRSWGWLLDNTLHHIQDLHVCHHLFSKMPFYHHDEATEAIKPILGDYYVRDDTNPLIALWQSMTTCIFMEDDGPVRFFKANLDD